MPRLWAPSSIPGSDSVLRETDYEGGDPPRYLTISCPTLCPEGGYENIDGHVGRPFPAPNYLMVHPYNPYPTITVRIFISCIFEV